MKEKRVAQDWLPPTTCPPPPFAMPLCVHKHTIPQTDNTWMHSNIYIKFAERKNLSHTLRPVGVDITMLKWQEEISRFWLTVGLSGFHVREAVRCLVNGHVGNNWSKWFMVFPMQHFRTMAVIFFGGTSQRTYAQTPGQRAEDRGCPRHTRTVPGIPGLSQAHQDCPRHTRTSGTPTKVSI